MYSAWSWILSWLATWSLELTTWSKYRILILTFRISYQLFTVWTVFARGTVIWLTAAISWSLIPSMPLRLLWIYGRVIWNVFKISDYIWIQDLNWWIHLHIWTPLSASYCSSNFLRRSRDWCFPRFLPLLQFTAYYEDSRRKIGNCWFLK